MTQLRELDFAPEVPDNAIGILCGYEVSPPGSEALVYQSHDDPEPVRITGKVFQTGFPLVTNKLYIKYIDATNVTFRLQAHFKKTDQPPLKIEVSDDVLKAIGHLVAQWAYLESLIDENIEKLATQLQELDTDQILRRGFKQRRKFWNSLIEKAPNDPMLTPRLLLLTKEIGEIEAERHKLVHARWVPSGKKEDIFTAFVDSPGRAFQWSVDAERIEQTALKIAKINRALFYILQDFGAEQPPSIRLYEILGSIDLTITDRRRSRVRGKHRKPKQPSQE